MQPLLAELTVDPDTRDERGAARRELRLGVPASSVRDTARVLIRNLSETGLMMETAARLAVGDAVIIDLPEAGPTQARIVWNRQSSYGCEFAAPVSKGAVSAALLLTPFAQPASAPEADWEPAARPFPRYDLPEARKPEAGGLASTIGLAFLAVTIALFILALLAAPISME